MSLIKEACIALLHIQYSSSCHRVGAFTLFGIARRNTRDICFKVLEFRALRASLHHPNLSIWGTHHPLKKKKIAPHKGNNTTSQFFLLYILLTVFLRFLEGACVPADGTESASPEADLLLGDAVDFSEDGPSQQDVDPRVEDLIPGCHPDARHHELAVHAGVLNTLLRF